VQVSARALAQASVFVAAYLVVAVYAPTTPAVDADLVAVLVPGAATAALAFGWSLADGSRSAPGAQPVGLWAAASVVAAAGMGIGRPREQRRPPHPSHR